MSQEGLPEQNPYTRELMSLVALQLNVHEMHGQARRDNERFLNSMRQSQRTTAQRYLVIERPGQSKPMDEQIIPVRCERIILLPAQGEHEYVKRVIVRVPVPAREERTSRSGELRNAFIEVVNDYDARVRFLLNNAGLWRYRSVEDLMSSSNDGFVIVGNNLPESSDTMELLSRYIAQSSYGQQTSFDA